MSDNQIVVDALNEPTPTERINFRVGFKNKTGTKACMLAYVDARYVMDRLDSAVGKDKWSASYELNGQTMFCTIEVVWPDGKVTRKTDCGMETEVDAEKGQASDAFKRAAVHYGIGRDLYSMKQHWATVENGYVDRDWKPIGWGESAQQTSSGTTTTTTSPTVSQPPTTEVNEAQETVKRLAKQAEERGEGDVQQEQPQLRKGTPPESEFVRIKNLRLIRSSDKSHLLIPDTFVGDTGDFEQTKPYWIPKSKILDLNAMPSGKYTLDVQRWIAEQTLDDGSDKFTYEEMPVKKQKEEPSEVSTTIDDDDLPF